MHEGINIFNLHISAEDHFKNLKPGNFVLLNNGTKTAVLTVMTIYTHDSSRGKHTMVHKIKVRMIVI